MKRNTEKKHVDDFFFGVLRQLLSHGTSMGKGGGVATRAAGQAPANSSDLLPPMKNQQKITRKEMK